MTFLIPDEGKWLDPRNGKHVLMSGFRADPNTELVEVTDQGFRRHPMPKAADVTRGADRGPIMGSDYRALLDNGVDMKTINDMNSKYLMEQLGRNP